MPGTADLDLNAIGVLRRRAIEARILAPILAAMGREFGDDRVRAIARDVIIGIAREQGAALAAAHGGRGLPDFATTLEHWTAGEALQLEVLESSEDRLAFNVTRCRYAEMYTELGVPELGAILSCNRDAALIEGFNPGVTLTRTQTIMQGAPCCDFRYELRRADRSAGD